MRAGLPGDQAVSIVPRSDLLTVGAVVLAAFGFVAAIAVAFTYLVDPRGTTSTQTRVSLMILVGLGMAVPIYYAESDRSGTKLVAGLVVFVLFVAGVLVAVLCSRRDRTDAQPPPPDAADPPDPPPAEEPSGPFDWLLGLRKEEAVAAPGPQEKPGKRRLTRLGLTFQLVIVVAGALLLWAIFAIGNTHKAGWVPASLLVLIALYALCISIAGATPGFFPFGLTVFVAVGVFGGIVSVMRYAYTAPRVQPVAAVTKTGRAPVCGIYVGESSDRLYIGQVDPDAKTANLGLLFWVDKAELTNWTVGRLQRREPANRALRSLERNALRERRLQIKQTTSVTTTGKTKEVKTTREATRAPKPRFGRCKIWAAGPQLALTSISRAAIVAPHGDLGTVTCDCDVVATVRLLGKPPRRVFALQPLKMGDRGSYRLAVPEAARAAMQRQRRRRTSLKVRLRVVGSKKGNSHTVVRVTTLNGLRKHAG
jgi:hypothetical protein